MAGPCFCRHWQVFRCSIVAIQHIMEEGKGFEPLCRVNDHHLSRMRTSTSHATFHIFGIPRETRTPTKGFGDPYAAITLARYLVRVAGIEPARLSSSDFKSDASTNFTTLAINSYLLNNLQ